MLRTVLFAVVVFVVGVLAGVVGASIQYRSYSALPVGELLDQDRIYLLNGDVLAGRVIAKDNGKVLFSIVKGTAVEFEPREIKKLDENFYTRYLKDLL